MGVHFPGHLQQVRLAVLVTRPRHLHQVRLAVLTTRPRHLHQVRLAVLITRPRHLNHVRLTVLITRPRHLNHVRLTVLHWTTKANKTGDGTVQPLSRFGCYAVTTSSALCVAFPYMR